MTAILATIVLGTSFAGSQQRRGLRKTDNRCSTRSAVAGSLFEHPRLPRVRRFDVIRKQSVLRVQQPCQQARVGVSSEDQPSRLRMRELSGCRAGCARLALRRSGAKDLQM